MKAYKINGKIIKANSLTDAVRSCKDNPSDLTNIRVLKKEKYKDFDDGREHTLSLVEYIPQGNIDDGSMRKLWAVIRDYNGEKIWTKGAIVSVSERLGRQDFDEQLKMHKIGTKAYLRGDSVKDSGELKKLASNFFIMSKKYKPNDKGFADDLHNLAIDLDKQVEKQTSDRYIQEIDIKDLEEIYKNVKEGLKIYKKVTEEQNWNGFLARRLSDNVDEFYQKRKNIKEASEFKPSNYPPHDKIIPEILSAYSDFSKAYEDKNNEERDTLLENIYLKLKKSLNDLYKNQSAFESWYYENTGERWRG